jgi:hypothetical protein
MVPVLPQVVQAVADYVALSPYRLPPEGPLFVGAKGGPLSLNADPQFVAEEISEAEVNAQWDVYV